MPFDDDPTNMGSCLGEVGREDALEQASPFIPCVDAARRPTSRDDADPTISVGSCVGEVGK